MAQEFRTSLTSNLILIFFSINIHNDNVICRYTTKSDEARHYVQYDQGNGTELCLHLVTSITNLLLCVGEDRWLCTLLLQRGYRVEYSAASDAYTHCPEGFNEFFQQRRRWVPSTMANIMDLLGDYKRTIQINDNISLPYILYQVGFKIVFKRLRLIF